MRSCCSILLLALLAACEQPGSERAIRDATRAVESAHDDGQRAVALAARGHAYSERARFGKVTQKLAAAEYERVVGLAFADLDRAVALAPRDAGVQFEQGRALYDHAVLADAAASDRRTRFEAAAGAFTGALACDPQHAQALDFRGLVHVALAEHEHALADFTALVDLDPRLGRLRLAEEYCTWGTSLAGARDHVRAIDALEKSIAMGVAVDGCECQPDSPLAWLYLETGQREKARATVERARRDHRWIAPEIVARLQ